MIPRQPSRSFPPVEEDPGDVGQAAPRCPQAQDQVVVLRPTHVPVPAHGGHGLRIEEEGGVGQGTLDEDRVVDLFGGGGAVDPGLVPAGPALQPRPGKVADAGAAAGEPVVSFQEGALREAGLEEARDFVAVA